MNGKERSLSRSEPAARASMLVKRILRGHCVRKINVRLMKIVALPKHRVFTSQKSPSPHLCRAAPRLNPAAVASWRSQTMAAWSCADFRSSIWLRAIQDTLGLPYEEGEGERFEEVPPRAELNLKGRQRYFIGAVQGLPVASTTVRATAGMGALLHALEQVWKKYEANKRSPTYSNRVYHLLRKMETQDSI